MITAIHETNNHCIRPTVVFSQAIHAKKLATGQWRLSPKTLKWSVKSRSGINNLCLLMGPMIFSEWLWIFKQNFTHLWCVDDTLKLDKDFTASDWCRLKQTIYYSLQNIKIQSKILLDMNTNQNACIKVFTKLANVDHCLWQVIPDLLQCTCYQWR